MLLKINLQEDAELRKYAKDLIKGQVLSIAREEIKNIIAEVFGKQADSEHIDYLVKDEIRKMAEKTLKNNNWGSDNFIKETARIEVNKIIMEALRAKAI